MYKVYVGRYVSNDRCCHWQVEVAYLPYTITLDFFLLRHVVLGP